MKVAIIGAGNMGGAIACGIAQHHIARVAVSNPSQPKLDAISREFPEVITSHDNTAVVKDADVVIIAVKPWKVGEIMSQISHDLKKGNKILISVAAGISLSDLEEMTGVEKGTTPIYRVIPNTAIAVGKSMTFVSGANATEDSDAAVLKIFDALGRTMIIEERLMGAGTALASCGIAYVFRYMRAQQEGGVQLGFYAADALQIILQTMDGAIELIRANNSHPEAEIDKVTTPGGLTIRGLNAMEQAGFTNAVIQGLVK